MTKTSSKVRKHEIYHFELFNLGLANGNINTVLKLFHVVKSEGNLHITRTYVQISGTL